jgi:hypothetical protein
VVVASEAVGSPQTLSFETALVTSEAFSWFPLKQKVLDFDRRRSYIVIVVFLIPTMIRRFLTITITTILLALTVFAGVIKEGSLRARSDGSNIILVWQSEDEVGVQKFIIERKAGVNGAFMLLAEVQPKGNNSSYQFVDETAFRALSESVYRYQIKVQFTNGSTAIYGPVTVIHRISDVTRRTWGSIKAMFR